MFGKGKVFINVLLETDIFYYCMLSLVIIPLHSKFGFLGPKKVLIVLVYCKPGTQPYLPWTHYVLFYVLGH
jgi:hypothetical protein